jgi:hypothetical protein
VVSDTGPGEAGLKVSSHASQHSALASVCKRLTWTLLCERLIYALEVSIKIRCKHVHQLRNVLL